MYKLVLQRHGESLWNKANIFTGWTDVDLSAKGIKEAHQAGKLLKKEGYSFDMAFTSYLKKAIRTLWITLDEMDLMWIPVEKSWRLNERCYGDLQGKNKAKMAKEVGEEQVLMWRRGYDVRPPEMVGGKKDPRYPGNEPRYKDLDESDLPLTESLKDTVARVLPYWNERIAPEIKSGKKVLISAHGNSLRALVKYLDNVPDQDVVGLNIPTGIPLVYELDDKLKPIKHYYLGGEAAVKKAIESVKKQGKAK